MSVRRHLKALVSIFLSVCTFVSPAFSQTNADSMALASMLTKARSYVNKPGSDPNDLKTAFETADKARSLSYEKNIKWAQAESYTTLSQIFREKGNPITGKIYAEKATAISGTNPDQTGQYADALIELASYYGLGNRDDIQHKVDLYQSAVSAMINSAPNTMKLADALKYLGDLYHVQNKADSAQIEIQKALAIYNALNYQKLQDIYCLAGEVAFMQYNTKQALKYELQAASLSERFKDSGLTQLAIYNRLGVIYYSLNQYDNAEKSYKKALDFAIKNNSDDNRMIKANMGRAYMYMGRSKEAFILLKDAIAVCPSTDTMAYVYQNAYLLDVCLGLKDYSTAKECYSRMNNLMKRYTAKDFISMNYHSRCADYLAATHQFDLIPPHINTLLQIANETKSYSALSSVEIIQSRIDSTKGNLAGALAHYKKYHLYKDSLSKINYNKEVSEMEVLYEADKKDRELSQRAKDIDDLQKRTTLQKEMLDSDRLSKILSFVGLALTSIVLLLGYSRYRLKLKSNRELKIKQHSIEQQNEELKQLLIEREWLLKEVNHRVKNNLQIVISLLDSQSAYLKNKTAQQVIKESRDRMSSISLIHQKLYLQELVAGIQMDQYIMDLIHNLKASFNLDGNISFETEVEPVLLDVSQAVPVGLILNESITNAIKYAFNNQSDRKINITLREEDNDEIFLSIQDNGPGLPQNMDMQQFQTLGIQLIHGLTAQLRGKLELINSDGLLIRITFPRIAILTS